MNLRMYAIWIFTGRDCARREIRMMRKPKPSDQTEAYIKKQVREILKDTGWKFWMPSAGIYGRNGVSDFLAVKKPWLFMAIETKYDDVPTVPQLEFLGDIHDAGHYAFLVDETNVEVLREVLLSNFLDPRRHPNYNLLMTWRIANTPIDIRIRKPSI
jgi:hypothetical protein